MLNPQDKFYFYHSSIGDLTEIIMRHVIPDVASTTGRVTNAFGVKIDPKYFPSILGGREGVEPPPIPANWHADIAEFGAALRAVELAEKNFVIAELGCGWGCWLNITGLAAKRRGLDVRLIGVEGDLGHVSFAYQALAENGFSPEEYRIYHGIAASEQGVALFPIQDEAGASWGLEPIFDVPAGEEDGLLIESGHYCKLPKIVLPALLPNDFAKFDLLHVDIQGGEIPLIPNSIDFLNAKVAMLLIGTHSRQIEGSLFDCMSGAGWVLEIERPAVLGVGCNIQTLVDGVQFWRNPRLVPVSK